MKPFFLRLAVYVTMLYVVYVMHAAPRWEWLCGTLLVLAWFQLTLCLTRLAGRP
jgi:hypothetical protein